MLLNSNAQLTGIDNRRALKSILEAQLSLRQRKGIASSLAMIDIDHFKSINANYGHPIGDRILKAMSDELRMKTRDSDILVRYGGEEFVLIMAATPLRQAEILCERIRQHVAQVPWEAFSVTQPLTISIGLTQMTSQDQAIDLVHRADAALYQAKRSGRNRLVIHDSESSDGEPQAIYSIASPQRAGLPRRRK